MNAPTTPALEKETSTAAPAKQTASELLERHGPTGRLVLVLQRYALTGWIAFFTLLTYNFFILTVSMFTPKPVIAVDESGRVLGTFEYMNPASRTDGEVLAASKTFVQKYMSLDSDHIFEEYTDAMNMMCDNDRAKGAGKDPTEYGDLYRASMQMVQAGYLSRIKAANSRSRVELDRDGAKIVRRADIRATTRLKGTMTFRAGEATQWKTQPFDVTLELRATPRTLLGSAGFCVSKISDN